MPSCGFNKLPVYLQSPENAWTIANGAARMTVEIVMSAEVPYYPEYDLTFKAAVEQQTVAAIRRVPIQASSG